ncbi:MAG: hypothetical protein HC897_11495 [Thermoanaerobaculia bacterium]|nr:hypothetical protein [Thermoanaerobaculia bacterium]
MQVEDIAWYRRLDNNPFVIDTVVIDKDSFSRSTTNLPAGHHYAMSANRAIGALLGFANTQAVMYSGIQLNMRYSGLAADDVNMVKMGTTGADRDAGTPDDYSIVLRYQNDCAGAHIQVRLDGTFIGDSTGACIADMQTSFPQGLLKVHYTLKPVTGFSVLMVDLNPLEPWDFGPHVFSSGFENGDFSEWSAHFP